MGAWGHLAFDNDDANDWAYGLEGLNDLSLVETALKQVEEAGKNYLAADIACAALAAREVLARLRGRHGYQNSYTKTVDDWVSTHPRPPSAELLSRAVAAIDRVVADASELRELWEGSDDETLWRSGLKDLRHRVSA